ncbi:WXG100 family type VII secretion target, partial [Streptomyces sp. CBMA370]
MSAESGGGGGGTDFRSMTHQQMLEWLDEASTFSVGNAAERLRAASAEMHRIATQLKNRTGRVDWKGEAEKSFTDWAESVVSATHSLGEYSTDAAKWMDHAAHGIATAQSATPRYTSHASAKANLEAAMKYRNDPDSATVARNAKNAMAASEDLKAIEAKEKENKEAAAAEMKRLSEAYTWATQNMKGLAAPSFPPPPGDFVPADLGSRREYGQPEGYTSQGERSRGTTGTTTGTYTVAQHQPDGNRTTSDPLAVPPSHDTTGPTPVIRPEVRPDVPVDLGIDSVGTLPNPTTTGPGPAQPGQPPLTKPDGGAPPLITTGVPPFTGKGGPGPAGPPAPVTGGGPRGPVTGGGPRGLGPLGGIPREGVHGVPREGISGGRPVPQGNGR